MSIFERFLTVWVGLCIVVGVALGHLMPGTFAAISGWEVAKVNLPVAVLIWLGFRAPMWWVWVALTFVIGRGGWSHPSVVVPQRGVLAAGRVTGIACLIVFLLTFVPVPFAG